MVVKIHKAHIPGLDSLTISEKDWETLDECLLCGSTEITGVMDVINGPALSTCAKCRFAFLSRRPVETWINNFYESTWDAAQSNTLAPVNIAVYEFCRDYVGKHIKVLDVGAGYGGVLRGFKQQGHDVYAIEPSQHRADYLRSQDIEVVTWEDGPDEYDLITMTHSLEHRYDPRAALKQAKEKLSQNGLLYVAVPDLYEEYPLQAAHYVPHLSLFTVESLVNLLADEGFAPRQASRYQQIQILSGLGSFDQRIEVTRDFNSTIDTWLNVGIGQEPNATLVWSTMPSNFRYTRWTLPGHWPDPELVLPIGFAGQTRYAWITEDNGVEREHPVILEHINGSQDTVWIK